MCVFTENIPNSQRPGDDHSWRVPWCRCTTHYVKHPSWLKDFLHSWSHIAAEINSALHRREKCRAEKATKVRWKENWFQPYFCSTVGKHDSWHPPIIICGQHQTGICEQLLQGVMAQFWTITQSHTASQFVQLSHQMDPSTKKPLKV